MGYFRVVAIIFGILMILTLVGICIFLADRGLIANDSICLNNNPKLPTSCELVDYPRPPAEPETYFSLLCLAGIIMLSIYCMPIIMRPFDFLANIRNYSMGFISYMLMMPVFTNVLQIYAMCNLHDVSWGNRPTSTGAEAFAAKRAEQEKLTNDYKVFRTNFVLCWLAANAAYYIAID